MIRRALIKDRAESRLMVEALQVEKKLGRSPQIFQPLATFQPPNVRKPTKQDYFELLKTINTRKYLSVEKKPVFVSLQNDELIGILKKKSEDSPTP